MTYKIIRHYMRTSRKYTLATGLTLEKAQAWCRDPETSSTTATGKAALARTRKRGPWFDGYEKE